MFWVWIFFLRDDTSVKEQNRPTDVRFVHSALLRVTHNETHTTVRGRECKWNLFLLSETYLLLLMLRGEWGRWRRRRNWREGCHLPSLSLASPPSEEHRYWQLSSARADGSMAAVGNIKKYATLLFPPFVTNLLRFLLNASVPTHGSTVLPAVCPEVSHSGSTVNFVFLLNCPLRTRVLEWSEFFFSPPRLLSKSSWLCVVLGSKCAGWGWL